MIADVPAESLRRLTAISRAAGDDERGLDEVLELAVRCAVELVGDDRAVLLLRDTDGRTMVRAGVGLLAAAPAGLGAPLDEKLPRALHGLLGTFDEADFLAAPVVVQGRIQGVLAVVARSPNEPSESLLSALADQVSVALEASLASERRVELERRLARAERRDSGGQHALEQLGHDLRTPLQAVRGYCEILGSGALGDLGERQREIVGRMEEVLRHTSAVIDQVLEIAALAGDAPERRRERFSLADVAAQAAAVVRGTPEGREVELRLEAAPETFAVGDPDRLRRVLVQLLDNAVKYAGRQGPIALRISPPDEGSPGWVAVEVADHGPGLPVEAVGDVFRPYRRFAGEGDPQVPGTGLGLAIAQRVVEAMGGRLEAANAPEGGAVFRVLLPGC